MTKLQMVEGMLKRVLHKGFCAPYLVADSWYSNKQIMNLAMQNGMCAVLRMKKGNTKYRVQVGADTKQLLHAKDIYSKCVRKLPGLPWQVFSLSVEPQLQSDPKQEPSRHPVQLLYVQALKENAAGGSRRDWALFLSTDDQLSPEKLLQIYSLRWSVEVYFKEAKQNLGFLSEQTRSFASFVASVHLCAVRHLMLTYASSTDGSTNLCEIREQFKDQLNQFSLARRLWQYFLALMGRVIGRMKTLTDDAVRQLTCTLSREFEQIFESSLQLDPETIRLEYDPAPLT